MYCEDYDETFPLGEYVVPTWQNPQADELWMTFIQPYVKSGDNTPQGGYSTTLGTSGVWQCPDFPDPTLGSSYGVSLLMMPVGTYGGETTAPAGPPLVCKEATLPSPADLVMVVDLGQNDGGGEYNYFDPEEDYWTTTAGNPLGSHLDDLDLGSNPNTGVSAGYPTGDCDGDPGSGNWTYAGCGMMPRYRHTNTTNICYADGHAKALVRGRMNWYQNIYIPGLYEETYTWMPPVY
jgi:prepilin-type processing-associated H-X9-DG protein